MLVHHFIIELIFIDVLNTLSIDSSRKKFRPMLWIAKLWGIYPIMHPSTDWRVKFLVILYTFLTTVRLLITLNLLTHKLFLLEGTLTKTWFTGCISNHRRSNIFTVRLWIFLSTFRIIHHHCVLVYHKNLFWREFLLFYRLIFLGCCSKIIIFEHL